MSFREAQRSGILVLDAALGTELTARGVDTSPPLWSARALEAAPELVLSIHRENVAAGADVVTACTFRTHGRNVEGRDAAALTRLAVALAKESGARFIAGSLSPLEDCYRPDLVPDDAALAREQAEQAERLASAGCDLILVETMNAVRELVTAARAAAATGLPVVASMVTDGGGRLLSGEPIERAVVELFSLPDPPVAIGVNCVPARQIGKDVALLALAAPGVALAAYGNTGLPTEDGRFTEPIDPEEFAALAMAWVALGARLVGGCCGTGATHTRAIRDAIGLA